MSKIKNVLDILEIEYSFPWATENFKDYFDNKSPWMHRGLAPEIFKIHTKLELTASNLSLISRSIERKYELQNSKKPFDWDKLIIFDKEYDLLYIAGRIDITQPEILDCISKNQLVIVKEPFDFSYSNKDLSKIDYECIAPKPDLLEEQKKYVTLKSANRKKIGFHIRRGDYLHYEQGRYYYDDEFWLSKIKEYDFKTNIIWIFTNEINNSFHEELTKLGAEVSNGSFEKDFVRMILMDEIHGPPSTFSAMTYKISNFVYRTPLILSFFPPKF